MIFDSAKKKKISLLNDIVEKEFNQKCSKTVKVLKNVEVKMSI